MMIRVTVEDLNEPGNSESRTVDDYILTVAAPCYLARITSYTNGTHILTLKNAARPAYNSTIEYVESPSGTR